MFGYVFEGDIGDMAHWAVVYDREGREIERKRFAFDDYAPAHEHAADWLERRGCLTIHYDCKD